MHNYSVTKYVTIFFIYIDLMLFKIAILLILYCGVSALFLLINNKYKVPIRNYIRIIIIFFLGDCVYCLGSLQRAFLSFINLHCFFF